MSSLSEIVSYWQAQLSAVPIFVDQVPANTAFPYAVIVASLGGEPDWTTSLPWIENFNFQISVFSPGLAVAEALAQQVCNTFDYGRVSANTISCERTGYMPMADPDSPTPVYHVAITYVLRSNRQLPLRS